MPAPRCGHDDDDALQELSAPSTAKSPFDLERSDPKHEVWPKQAAPSVDLHTDRTRYFVITSNTKDNVVKSVQHGLWATQRKNEQRLDDAYRTAAAVILVFSVNRSEAFQGYACMRSPVGRPRSRSVDPFNGFGRLFDIEWLRLHDLGYHEVEHLRNPLNGDRPVNFSRDGQELANDVGRRLCGIIDKHVDDPASFAANQLSNSHGQWRLWPGQQQVDGSRSRSCSSCSGNSGGRPHRKKHRQAKCPEAPNPHTADMEEQLAFFLGLDFEEYVEWWKQFGAVHPGPVLPPSLVPQSHLPMGSLPSVQHHANTMLMPQPLAMQHPAPHYPPWQHGASPLYMVQHQPHQPHQPTAQPMFAGPAGTGIWQ